MGTVGLFHLFTVDRGPVGCKRVVHSLQRSPADEADRPLRKVGVTARKREREEVQMFDLIDMRPPGPMQRDRKRPADAASGSKRARAYWKWFQSRCKSCWLDGYSRKAQFSFVTPTTYRSGRVEEWPDLFCSLCGSDYIHDSDLEPGDITLIVDIESGKEVYREEGWLSEMEQFEREQAGL